MEINRMASGNLHGKLSARDRERWLVQAVTFLVVFTSTISREKGGGML